MMGASVVLAALALLPVSRCARLSRIYGIFPGEDYLQDFWGPVRLGFEGSIDYEASYLAASDDDVGRLIGGIMNATAPGRMGDVLVVGPMRHGEAHYAELLRELPEFRRLLLCKGVGFAYPPRGA